MKKVLALLTVSNLVFGQEILQHFDLDKSNRYVGTTTYEFAIETLDETYRTLAMKDIKGDVTISGEPGNIIQITEEVSIWAGSGMKAKSIFDDYRAQVNQLKDAGIIEIRGRGEWSARTAFEYNIIIPMQFNVSVSTAGGDIEADNITGETSLSTSGGEISLANLVGKTTARTSGGDIDVENSEGSLELKTSGGDIQVEKLAGEVAAYTSGGDINIESVQGNVDVRTSGGELWFRDIVGRKLVGITSGGSIEAGRITADLDLQTSGGDIEIDDLTGSIEASTSGGDIEINIIYGNADVSTSGGDIVITGLRGSLRAKTSAGRLEIEKIWDRNFKEHSIDIVNDHGSIFLTLPVNFPSQIDAIVEHEISANVIDSDFPLTITNKQNEVHGEGLYNNGTYSVKLRTSHGSITIERGEK
ncbi:MAG: DUF4097 family beta strand repeat-containing protein [Candidatus Neomarinimicrobiota bacterium]